MRQVLVFSSLVLSCALAASFEYTPKAGSDANKSITASDAPKAIYDAYLKDFSTLIRCGNLAQDAIKAFDRPKSERAKQLIDFIKSQKMDILDFGVSVALAGEPPQSFVECIEDLKREPMPLSAWMTAADKCIEQCETRQVKATVNYIPKTNERAKHYASELKRIWGLKEEELAKEVVAVDPKILEEFKPDDHIAAEKKGKMSDAQFVVLSEDEDEGTKLVLIPVDETKMTERGYRVRKFSLRYFFYRHMKSVIFAFILFLLLLAIIFT